MGFSITALAQKARTQTLIVDSDLDMGQYDVIATDVKGDTAEFSEFVGGVGNFTSGLFSSGVDVSGILHAESTLQVDGNVILEGSINNVNIADNGEITTAQGVNGADFNGAKITSTKFNGATIDASGNVTGAKGTFSGAVTGTSFNGIPINNNLTYTVTPTTTYIRTTNTNYFLYLAPMFGAKFSGRIGLRMFNTATTANYEVNMRALGSSDVTTVAVPNTGAVVYLTFSNIIGLEIRNQYPTYVEISGYALS